MSEENFDRFIETGEGIVVYRLENMQCKDCRFVTKDTSQNPSRSWTEDQNALSFKRGSGLSGERTPGVPGQKQRARPGNCEK